MTRSTLTVALALLCSAAAARTVSSPAAPPGAASGAASNATASRGSTTPPVGTPPGTDEGRYDHLPFTESLLGVVLRAYREFEASTEIDVEHGARTRMVEHAVAALPVQFRVSEVRDRCPRVSPDTIKTALAKMAREGKVVCEGRGRSAVWRRLQ